MSRQNGRPRTTAISAKSTIVARPPIASKRAAALALLSLAGMAVGAYLTYVHYAGVQYFCAGLGDCNYVNSSPYAVLAGIPIAVLGFIAYAGILVASIISMRGSGELALSVAPLATFGISLGGVLFSAYLTYVELFILHAT